MGVQTGHHKPGSHAEGSSGGRGEREAGHRAKVQRTGQYQGPTESAHSGMRSRSDEPPKQSPFTEVRGKRQQYDIVDISDDDDDECDGAGTSNVFQWHRPGRQTREPPSHTITLADVAAFGVQEGGPTVTHHSIPAGEESDSDGFSSPFHDPYRVQEREDVSSGHELDSLVTDLGTGYDIDVEPLTPVMPLLEPEVTATPVTFVAEPLSRAVSPGVRDVAVGDDAPALWYSLPVGVSLQTILGMVQRNVGVPVREILATEVGSPEQQDSLIREVVETFTAFGAAMYQVTVRDLSIQLQNLELQICTASTPEAASNLRAAAWQTLTDLVARVRDWDIPRGLLGRYRQD